MSYRVLARAWRPQSFDDLIGQDAVVQTLHNALAAGTLGHAYLFSGLRGVGKTTVARLLAKAVNCQQGPTPSPCGTCQACTDILSGSSLDVVELDGASNRGIEDVRELRDLLRYRPSRDRFRVIIIDEVHMLTREAFNALLKSLEEPPSYILFVFATTERHRVPPTILSRCQQLEFRPVGSELIARHLDRIAEAEGFVLSQAAAAAVARASEGSVRDALSLVDQLRAFASDRIDEEAVAAVLGVPTLESLVELVERLASGDAAAGLKALRGELQRGHDATVLYRETGRLLQTLLHLALAPELEPAAPDAQRPRLTDLAERLGVPGLTRMLGLWAEQDALMQAASNRELTLEVAALRLARWPDVRRLDDLLSSADGVPVAGPEEAGGAGSPPATSGRGA